MPLAEHVLEVEQVVVLLLAVRSAAQRTAAPARSTRARAGTETSSRSG